MLENKTKHFTYYSNIQCCCCYCCCCNPLKKLSPKEFYLVVLSSTDLNPTSFSLTLRFPLYLGSDPPSAASVFPLMALGYQISLSMLPHVGPRGGSSFVGVNRTLSWVTWFELGCWHVTWTVRVLELCLILVPKRSLAFSPLLMVPKNKSLE